MAGGPTRWFWHGGYATFTIYDIRDGKFNLCVGDNGQVIGTYNSPTEAAIALSNKATDSDEWNSFLIDKEVPKRFKDWEIEDDE